MTSKAADIVKDLRKKKLDVSLLNDEDSPCVVGDWISTGCVALDVITGGGLPVGRLSEYYGDPSSGKSLIAAQVAANAQEDGYIVAYADTEGAVSIPMMEKVGVNIDELIYAAPDTMEDVFNFFDSAIESKSQVDPDNKMVLIWDSVAASSTEAEQEKDYGKIGYMDHARVMSQALRKIKGKFAEHQVAALFLNQTREKLGVMFGDKVATFGGKAVSFYSSVRVYLDITTKLSRMDGKKKRIIGMNTKAICVKNKLAMPFKDTVLPIYFGHGIDDDFAALNWLLDNGYLEGTNPYKMTIGNEEIKFKKNTWRSIYDKNFDAISDMMLATIYEENDVNDR